MTTRSSPGKPKRKHTKKLASAQTILEKTQETPGDEEEEEDNNEETPDGGQEGEEGEEVENEVEEEDTHIDNE